MDVPPVLNGPNGVVLTVAIRDTVAVNESMDVLCRVFSAFGLF